MFGSSKLIPFIKATASGSKGRLLECAPDSIKYYVKDSWNNIAFYDCKILDADVEAVSNVEYEVSIKVSCGKTLHIDGEEKRVTMDDYIDVGLFGEDNIENRATSMLKLHRFRVKDGESILKVTVNKKPKFIGLNPFIQLIDKTPEDNLFKME